MLSCPMETRRKAKETAPTLQIPDEDTEKPRKLHQPYKFLMETHRKTKETAPTLQIPNGNTQKNQGNCTNPTNS